MLLWTLIVLILAQRVPVLHLSKLPNLCKYIRAVLNHEKQEEMDVCKVQMCCVGFYQQCESCGNLDA